MPDMALKDFMFALLGFSVTFVHSFLGILPFFFFEMRMFILYYCMSKVRNLVLYFYRGSQLSVLLESQRRLWIRLLSNAVKTMGRLGDGLNVFCIIRCT